MKANAPDRLYLSKNIYSTYLYQVPDPDDETAFEYTRTDAFIEKADEFIGSFFHPDDTELRNCLLKKFHEYMEGE